MSLLLRIAILCVLLCSAPNLFSQTFLITHQTPDNLVVCQNDTLFVQVQNPLAQSSDGVTVSIGLPNGMAYVPGSVNGATPVDLSNPQLPVFGLGALAAGQTSGFFVVLEASCALIDGINNGLLFEHNINVTGSTGTALGTTPTYAVETGLLVISSITPQVFGGAQGTVFTRTIRVQNTRLGRIESIVLRDSHQPGILINLPGASSSSLNNSVLDGTYSGAFFTQFGDGDVWFENGETVDVEEVITVNDCGDPTLNVNSGIRISWGCDNSLCQFDSTTAVVQVVPSIQNPVLQFFPTYDLPENYCGQKAALQQLTVVNIGSDTAVNTYLKLSSQYPSIAGLDASSFETSINGGPWIPLSIATSVAETLEACGLTVPIKAEVYLPPVAPGDTLVLRFGSLHCSRPCETQSTGFKVDYFYTKSCPPGGYDLGNLMLEPVGMAGEVHQRLKYDLPSCLDTGQTYAFEWEVISERLSTQNGVLKLTLDYPLGLFPDSSCLPNPAPLDMEINSNNMVLTYGLPLPVNFLNISFCLKYDCSNGLECYEPNLLSEDDFVILGAPNVCEELCRLLLKSKATVLENDSSSTDCGESDCGSYVLYADNTCYEVVDPFSFGLAGVQIYDLEIYRLNKGLKDNDNNRFADNLQTADHPDLRLDRIIPGDTIRHQFHGVAIQDTIKRISFRLFTELIANEMKLSGADSFYFFQNAKGFINLDSIELISAGFRIKRVQTGEVFDCPAFMVYEDDGNNYQIVVVNQEPAQQLDALISMYRYFLLDSSSGCFPDDFLLLQGDSLIFTADYRFKQNFIPDIYSNVPQLVNFHAGINDLPDLYHWNRPHITMQYSGYKEQFKSGIYTIHPCQNSVEVKPFTYEINLARPHLFPFEVRPLSRITSFRHSQPPTFSLLEANMQLWQLQDSLLVHSPQQVGSTLNNMYRSFDLSPFYNTLNDEGYHWEMQLKWEPDCGFENSDSATTVLIREYPPCFALENPDTVVIGTTLAYFTAFSKPQLSTPLSDIQVDENTFEVDLNYSNPNVSNVSNLWVRVWAPDNNLTDVALFSLPSGTPLPLVNGFFQVGSLGGFQNMSLQLQAINTSCAPTDIHLFYGWDCAYPTSIKQGHCFSDTLTIQLLPVLPELELSIIEQPPFIPLCAPSDYFELEIYNANDGFAYDVLLQLQLPAGVTVVPGSTEIAFPSGSAFQSFGDPQVIAPNEYQWQTSDLAVLSDTGLAGVLASPDNGVRLRFRLEAVCGFVSNAQPVFTTLGENLCGGATNVLRKPGAPLLLENAPPAYAVNIGLSMTPSGAFTCQEMRTVMVDLNLQGSPTAGDSIYLQLPAGFGYVNASYTPGLNAPSEPPLINGNHLQLPLPAGLPIGSSIQFSIQVQYNQAETGCTGGVMSVRTLRQAIGYCVSADTSCSVYVGTGEALLELPANANSLNFNASAWAVSGDNLNGTVVFSNPNGFDVAAQLMNIWLDLNGNQVPDSGDTLISTVSIGQTIAGFANLQMPFSLNHPGEEALCRLMLELPSTKNCLCGPTFQVIENITVQRDTVFLCSPENVQIGIGNLSGHTYQWSQSDNLDCPTCASAVFSNGLAGGVYSLELIDNGPLCTVTNEITVGFGTPGGIIGASRTVCRGDTLHARTDGGYAVVWTGPGITTPSNPLQILMPLENSTYVVQLVKDTCMYFDTLHVLVVQPDSVVLADLTTCKGKPVQVFGNSTDVPGLYCQSLVNMAGCDSVVCLTLTVETFGGADTLSVCQGDSVLVFGDTWVSSSQTVCRTLTLADGCDSLHCTEVRVFNTPVLTALDSLTIELGDTVQLPSPGNFDQYLWTPSGGLSCTTCASPLAYPTQTTDYTVQVWNENGCKGQVTYRVVVFPPCNGDLMAIPTAFTPDGDGVNETFRLPDEDVFAEIASMQIFNRWGTKVYSATGPTAAWDGTQDGKPAPSDTYVYIVELLCPNGKTRRVGDVTLMR